jgi:hypothetical protein
MRTINLDLDLDISGWYVFLLCVILFTWCSIAKKSNEVCNMERLVTAAERVPSCGMGLLVNWSIYIPN